MIALYRRNRKRKTHDGRPLRRAQQRWKVERTVAWVYRYRRIVVRYERYGYHFLGFVQIACVLLLLQQIF
ncbi:transposase [bacterium]|nr:transposase [bacterium]